MDIIIVILTYGVLHLIIENTYSWCRKRNAEIRMKSIMLVFGQLVGAFAGEFISTHEETQVAYAAIGSVVGMLCMAGVIVILVCNKKTDGTHEDE